MSSLEHKFCEVFDAVTLPPTLKEDTLLLIGEKRRELEGVQLQTTSQAKYVQPQASKAQALQTLSEQSQGLQAQSLQDIEAQPPSTLTQKQYTQDCPATQAQQPQPRNRRRPSRTRRSILALAACFLLVVMGFGGLTAYATQTAIVDIELNPSIELGINRFDRVVAARANNADGQLVLNEVSLIGRSFDEALALITTSQAFLSFVNDTSLMDVSVVCADDGQSNQLVQSSEATLLTLPYGGMCQRVSAEHRQSAVEAGMGVGRYDAAQTLMSLDSQVDLSDCQTMSMKEMRDRITQLDPSNSYALHGANASIGHGQNNSGMHSTNNTSAHE